MSFAPFCLSDYWPEFDWFVPIKSLLLLTFSHPLTISFISILFYFILPSNTVGVKESLFQQENHFRTLAIWHSFIVVFECVCVCVCLCTHLTSVFTFSLSLALPLLFPLPHFLCLLALFHFGLPLFQHAVFWSSFQHLTLNTFQLGMSVLKRDHCRFLFLIVWFLRQAKRFLSFFHSFATITDFLSLVLLDVCSLTFKRSFSLLLVSLNFLSFPFTDSRSDCSDFVHVFVCFY